MSELAITTLRDSTNRINELVLIDGKLSVSSKTRVIGEELLNELSAAVHQRDKIACIAQTSVSGSEQRPDKPFIIVNTSMKDGKDVREVVCFDSTGFKLLKPEEVINKDAVIGIYVMHFGDVSVSFDRFQN